MLSTMTDNIASTAPAPGSRWEHFHHDADIGVRGWGATMAEAFEQAALAMTAVVSNPESIRETWPVQISCANDDPDFLLVDWLNAVVLAMATRQMLFSRFKVFISGKRLEATAWGENVNVGRHQPAVEVKGATLTELVVHEDAPGRWVAQCVVDV
jgi:SHS2 domain-containing protein